MARLNKRVKLYIVRSLATYETPTETAKGVQEEFGITGEAGDNIGRGGRTTMYFLDEWAFVERQEAVDAAISQNTNVHIKGSTPNGIGDKFHQDRFSGRYAVFTMAWRDNPDKNWTVSLHGKLIHPWYEKQIATLDDIVLAQEVDIDYAASVEGVLIPSAWVEAAVDSHIKLEIQPSGERNGALDVADEGKDKNSFASRHGIVLQYLDTWSGIGDDIFGTTQKAIDICLEQKLNLFFYDADGLGAGVRGDVKQQAIADMDAMATKAQEYYKKASDGALEFKSKGVQALDEIGKTQDQKNAESLAQSKATLDQMFANQQSELNGKKITEDEKLKAVTAYAESAIAANKGVMDGMMQADLIAKGYRVTMDQAGKVSVQAFNQATDGANNTGKALVQARKGAEALGVDLDIALNRVSEKFAANQNHLTNYANGLDELGLKGEQAANALSVIRNVWERSRCRYFYGFGKISVGL